MPISRFSLLTLFVALCLAGLMLRSNLAWKEVRPARNYVSHEAQLLRRAAAPYHGHKFHYRYRTRGWFRAFQAEVGIPLPENIDTGFKRALAESGLRQWEYAWDSAAVSFNVAICLSILLVVVLVMSMARRLLNGKREPAGRAPPVDGSNPLE
jgi:hypothetical protein